MNTQGTAVSGIGSDLATELKRSFFSRFGRNIQGTEVFGIDRDLIDRLKAEAEDAGIPHADINGLLEYYKPQEIEEGIRSVKSGSVAQNYKLGVHNPELNLYLLLRELSAGNKPKQRLNVNGHTDHENAFSYEPITTQKSKTEVYRRQMRMAQQITTALNSANIGRDYTGYERVSRLLSGLERDVHEHGTHLFKNQNLATNFIRDIENAMLMGRRVIVQTGLYNGRDGYSLQIL